jgi:Flp pilus assembly protein TadD
LSGAHANLGTVLALLGQGEASIREFRLAVEGDPASAVARLNLALGLRAGGESAEARQQLEQALRIAPGLFEGHLALGEILLAAGEREGAAAHLRRAAESPDARVRGAAQQLLGGR